MSDEDAHERHRVRVRLFSITLAHIAGLCILRVRVSNDLRGEVSASHEMEETSHDEHRSAWMVLEDPRSYVTLSYACAKYFPQMSVSEKSPHQRHGGSRHLFQFLPPIFASFTLF